MKKKLLGFVFIFFLVILILPTSSFAQGDGGYCSDPIQDNPDDCSGSGAVWVSSENSPLPSSGLPIPQGGLPIPTVEQNGNNFRGDNCDVSTIGGLICRFQSILNSIIPLLVGIGFVYFVWGVVTYMIGDDEEAKTKGKDRIIYGIIGFVVISSLWALVGLVVNTFELDGNTASQATQFIEGNQSLVPSGACELGRNPKISNLFNYVTCTIFSSVVPLLFAVAVVMFVWGVVNFFILNADEEAKREQGKQFIIWGIIALFSMVSIWGMVRMVGSTFGISNVIPQVQEKAR